jgi:hypothetical protein
VGPAIDLPAPNLHVLLRHRPRSIPEGLREGPPGAIPERPCAGPPEAASAFARVQERDVRQLSLELDTLLPSMSRVQAFGVTPPRRHALPADQRGPLDALRNHDLNKQRLL